MSVKLNFTAQDLIDANRINADELRSVRHLVSDGPYAALNDEQLALFLLSCDKDENFTLETIREYFTSRKSGPALFLNRNMDRTDYLAQLDVVRFGIIPHRLEDGTGVVFHGLSNYTYSNYNMEHSMSLLMMTLDALTFDVPPTGLLMLFDMKGVGLMHLTKIKMGLLRTFCHYLQQGLPVKLTQIHVLNTQYFIDKVMILLKPFIKKELIEKIHFHSEGMDLKEFADKVMPLKCLPSDFGGSAPRVDDLHSTNTAKLLEMQQYFDAEEVQRKEIMSLIKK